MIPIPVIDLSADQVVHARGGKREAYAPVESILCDSSEPCDVVTGLLNLYPFTHLYIADLDAIRGQGDQFDLVQALCRRFPDLRVWVDPGIDDRTSLRRWLDTGLATPVLGSESLRDTGILSALPAPDSAVLSLDYRGERLLDAAGVRHRTRQWPARVIAMCLDRVGSDRGPAVERLRRLQNTAPRAAIYAAGGIRDLRDIQRLRDMGLAGVLLASALHDGRLGAAQLRALSAAPSP